MQQLTIDLYSFNELPPEAQEKFIAEEIDTEIQRICEGFPSFWVDDEEDEIGVLIMAAQKEMEEMRTECFLAERLMEDKAITGRLRLEAIHSLNNDAHWAGFFLYGGEYHQFEHYELLDV